MEVTLDCTRAAELLDRPLQLKGLTLKNRVVMPPMVTNFALADGEIGARTIQYYAARARGGVGTVVVETAYVAQDGRAFAYGLGACEDRHAPGLSELADAIHGNGALAAIQLMHAGRRAVPELTGTQPVGPSAIATTSGVVPQELDAAGMRALVEAFGSAARRVRSAGFDMLELHAAHGYLLNQFLSPLSNRRGDEYGGSLESRMRFPVDVIAGVRREVGADFPIMMRIPGDEFAPGGLTVLDAPEIARRLAGAGVDVMDVSAGVPESPDMFSVGLRRRPANTPKGYLVPLAAPIKAAVAVPVMAVGRLSDPIAAAEVLAERKADLIGIGRGLIADPDWTKKALNGEVDDIQRCTYCTGCVRQTGLQQAIVCKRNQWLGREYLAMVVQS